MIAKTPEPPYYAVIFTSLRTDVDDGYGAMADLLVELAQEQDGYLGIEFARSSDVGLTISYWRDLESIKQWKQQSNHQVAQGRGKSEWYTHYKTRIAKVERDYEFSATD